MPLKERLSEDLKDSMRKGDTLRRSVIRYLRAAIQNEEISRQAPLDDAGVAIVISRQVRQRRESITEFRKGNRPDLVEKEEAELAILMEYLPQQMTRAEIAEVARRVIQEVGARGPAERGRVMGALMPQVRGVAEGSEVSDVVSQLLQEMAGT